MPFNRRKPPFDSNPTTWFDLVKLVYRMLLGVIMFSGWLGFLLAVLIITATILGGIGGFIAFISNPIPFVEQF